MDAIADQTSTLEAFEAIVNLPENADKRFEWVGGEIVEVPSNAYCSMIAARIIRYLGVFVDDHNLGYVTGEAGGYMVDGERYAPDAAYISKARQPQLAQEGYNPNPPDLAVEVISPSDSRGRLSIKLGHYLAAGVVVWVADPDARQIEVYAPGQSLVVVDVNGVVEGGAVLPGFSLAVKDVFRVAPE